MDGDKARCIECRSEILIPESFANGDIVPCGRCDTKHRLQRGRGSVRLVLADASRLRESLLAARQRIRAVQSDLARARASWGIGVNGLGVGLIYLLVKLMVEDQPWSDALLRSAIGVALLNGIGLEVSNYLFLAKRKAIDACKHELWELETQVKDLERKVREASRA